MQLMRRLEVKADELYKQKKIRGFCHLYNGQEAVAQGMVGALREGDSMITAYRDHVFPLLVGDEPKTVLAELMGKFGGVSKGKGGSMHMYNTKRNFYGGNGIVGAQVPVGAGIAFAHKYKEDGFACLAFYGDGASNQGQVFEAYNMSALWKLPVIYICENNKYGMGTSASRSSANTLYYKRCEYIPGIRVDGMNVLATRNAYRYALNHAVNVGPIILEMETYRYYGHSMSDPGTTYRSRDDVQQVRKTRDPISKVKTWILENNFATEEEIKKIDAEVNSIIDEAIVWAEKSEFPPELELYHDVYVEDVPVRAVELSKSYNPK